MGALVTESKAFIQVRMIIFLLITLSACAADNFPITNHVNMSEEFIEPPYDVKSGGCPPLSTIPVANLHAYLPRDDYFYAGRYYKGQGNDLTNLACNGDAFEIPDGYQKSATYGSVFPMGSILVNPGCTVYLYDTYNWEGNYRYKYSGGREGITIPKVPVGNIPGYPACFRSYSWSCAQSFPSCGPWDDWRYITTLNNSDSNSTKTFTFQQKIGTTLSDAIEQSMSVSDRVAASLYFNFFNKFSVQLGLSFSTWFSWGTLTDQEKSETEEFDVQTDVAAGETVEIQSVVGACGASVVHTHEYRVKNNDAIILPNWISWCLPLSMVKIFFLKL